MCPTPILLTLLFFCENKIPIYIYIYMVASKIRICVKSTQTVCMYVCVRACARVCVYMRVCVSLSNSHGSNTWSVTRD